MRCPWAFELLCAAVNANSASDSVTIEQLRKAFAGDAVLWRDIREAGVAARINLCPSPFAAESDLFQKIVMLDTPLADVLLDRTAEPCHQKDNAEAVVGAVIKDPHAIGYFRLGDARSPDKRVRVLGIADENSKPVRPTLATVNDGTYLLTDKLTLYVRHDARPEVRELCNFALGPAAAKIARNCGYWPAYDMKPLDEKTRLAEVKAHHAAEIAVSGSAAWQALMKDLGTEFCKAKTAVEIRYHPVSQDAAVGEFVGGRQPSAQPSPPAPLPSTGEGRQLPSHPANLVEGQGRNAPSPAAALPSPPAPLPSTGEGRKAELLLIDSILDDKTVAAYDKPWSALKPREVPLGWRVAGIIVHPTNPVSVISFRQLRDVFSGKIKDWGEVGQAGSGEQGAGSTERGAGLLEMAKGAIRIYGPPRDDPICGLMEAKLGLGGQHVADSAPRRYRQGDPYRGPRRAGAGAGRSGGDAARRRVREDVGHFAARRGWAPPRA